MKKLNKKGFTIVELVIVIAVIAILAAVLIPTFSGVVEKANKSAALQAARSAYVEAKAEVLSDGVINTEGETVYLAKDGSVVNNAESSEWTFVFNTDGSINITRKGDTKYDYSFEDGAVKVKDKTQPQA